MPGPVWVDASEAVKGVLRSTTIADVVEREARAGSPADVLHLGGPQPGLRRYHLPFTRLLKAGVRV